MTRTNKILKEQNRLHHAIYTFKPTIDCTWQTNLNLVRERSLSFRI